MRVASLLLAVRENDTAIGLLRKLCARQGATLAPWAQFDLALAHLLAGRHEEASDQVQHFITALRSTRSESGQIIPWWSLAGIAYARLGQGGKLGQYSSSVIFEACPSIAQASGWRQSLRFRKQYD